MRTIEEINKRLACKAKCETCKNYQACEETFDVFCDDVLAYTSLLNGIPLDRLEAIAEAERDGRCVVLPCKVGQIIWFIGIDYTKCSAYGEEYDDVSCAGCEKECDSQKTYNVYATKAESLDWILRRTGSFGTTYFITHEAAQAALEGGAK